MKKDVLNGNNIEILKDILSNIKYGTVTLVIQDNVLIQIDKNEKIRLK
ncbi:Uncharacterized small protein [Clostridium sp. DSM 8431]|nr:YezD family protein [Clostridium sp. DSM 8431]SFU52604.1 Uncharacterized small protein [Clostridium sp. DSM 8431]